MLAPTSAPLSCRTCSFFGKCFGPQAKPGALPEDAATGDFISVPMTIGGIATRVLRSGTNGHPVVFIHGAGGRADRWAYNLHAIAQGGCRAYAPDLPGHGLAEKRSDFDHSADGYCGFLDQFLDAIGAEQATLVGTSFGGAIAAHFAVRHPQRVTALVLAASPGIVPIGPELRERLRRIAVFRSREAAAERLRRTFLSPRLATDALVEEEFLMNSSPGARECLEKLSCYIAERLDDDAVGEKLKAFAQRHPVLFVWGAEDRILPLAVGQASLAAIGGHATLAVIAEAAHAAHYERPERFNRLVADFLAGELCRRQIEGVALR